MLPKTVGVVVAVQFLPFVVLMQRFVSSLVFVFLSCFLQ